MLGEVGMPGQEADVTSMLRAAVAREPGAEQQLCEAIYADLRAVSARALREEDVRHTLQPTALVHEAYLKLIRQEVDWENRAHFFAVAARMMRRVLVDHARGKHRLKRGGGAAPQDLSITIAAENSEVDLVALDDALEALSQVNPIGAKVVEMRFFGGQSNEEIAQALDTSESTVIRRWRHARAWLYRELGSDGGLRPS